MSTTKTVRKLRTRGQWAARIGAAHKKTVGAFLNLAACCQRQRRRCRMASF